MRLNLALTALPLLLSAQLAFAADDSPKVDFDGNCEKSKSSVCGLIDAAMNDATPRAISEGRKAAGLSGNGARGVAAMKVVEVLESGDDARINCPGIPPAFSACPGRSAGR